MSKLSEEEKREYFERAAEFMKSEIGEDRIISAVVHMDEKTPHMHLAFCPINKEGKLSAKSILGNQKSLSEWQTRYYEFMHERWNELERGQSAQVTKRKHIPTWLFKMADNLDYLYHKLSNVIENINLIGMKKDKAEAIELLSEFVPKAQKISAKVNSYKDYIRELEIKVINQKYDNKELMEENNELKKEMGDKEFETSMKLMNMQNQIKKYEKYIKKIPKDVLDEDVARIFFTFCLDNNGQINKELLINLVEGYNSISKLTIEDLINGIKILWCLEVGLWIKEAYYIDNTPEKVKKFMFEINWITDNWFDLENIIKI